MKERSRWISVEWYLILENQWKVPGNVLTQLEKKFFSVKAILKQHLEEKAYLNQTRLSYLKMKLFYINTQDCPKINTFEKVLFSAEVYKVVTKLKKIFNAKTEKWQKNLAREHFLSSKNYAQAWGPNTNRQLSQRQIQILIVFPLMNKSMEC